MLVDSGLLRLTSEIEIGDDAPSLKRLYFLNYKIGNVVSGLQELIAAAGGIRKNYQEENRRLAVPVGPKRWTDTQNMGPKLLSCARNLRIE